MPTASDEQRDTMQKWFGDPISETGPIEFLKSHGYTLRRDWQWELPTPSHSISCYEAECLLFLCDEWDFGHIANVDKFTVTCLCGQAARLQ